LDSFFGLFNRLLLTLMQNAIDNDQQKQMQETKVAPRRHISSIAISYMLNVNTRSLCTDPCQN
jgi:hypothetical protein